MQFTISIPAEHEALQPEHLQLAPPDVAKALFGNGVKLSQLLKWLGQVGVQLWPLIDSVLKKNPGISGNALFRAIEAAISFYLASQRPSAAEVPPMGESHAAL